MLMLIRIMYEFPETLCSYTIKQYVITSSFDVTGCYIEYNGKIIIIDVWCPTILLLSSINWVGTTLRNRSYEPLQ